MFLLFLQIFVDLFKEEFRDLNQCELQVSLDDISKMRMRQERKRLQTERPEKYGQKGSLTEIGIGITNMYGSRNTGNSAKIFHSSYFQSLVSAVASIKLWAL